jgi:16S rRNA (guanine527-N7)-methyltransferase
LVDSIGKKLKVVEAVSTALGISNITIQHSRAEDIKGRKFDFAVSRAVAPLGDLWKWSRPLLRKERKMEDLKNGLICLKGGDLTEEIAVSNTRPHQQPIGELFDQPFFDEKYILYVPL